MQVDEEMDHGPIIVQKKVIMPHWPPTATELGQALVQAGADLLVEILPDWILGKIRALPQDHAQATYTKKIEKADGLIDLEADAYTNYLKIQAFSKWPTAYFFIEKNNKKTRVIIKKAIFENGTLEILRVVPEGKREMDFKDFIR
jgi:methionyl-tRNA formyltransferase